MATPIFPDGLPNPSSFSWGPTSQTLSTEGDGVVRYIRRISREPSAEASISWQFTSAQNESFWSWWTTDLLQGHRWFLVNIPSAVGIRSHLVRFIDHPKRSTIGHNYRRIDASIEILNRRILTDIVQLYITSTLYPLLGFDSLTSNLTLISGSFRSPTNVLESFTPTLTVLSGNLPVLLKSTNVLDSISSTFQIQSGELPTILKSNIIPVESIRPVFRLQSGTLIELLISNVVPIESLNISFEITSASLT